MWIESGPTPSVAAGWEKQGSLRRASLLALSPLRESMGASDFCNVVTWRPGAKGARAVWPSQVASKGAWLRPRDRIRLETEGVGGGLSSPS